MRISKEAIWGGAWRRYALGVLIVVGALVSIGWGQYGKTSQRGRARTSPISDNMVTLKLTLSTGEVVTAVQREGGMVRIDKQGSIIGLTPKIRDKEDGTIDVAVFRISAIKGPSGAVVGEGMDLMERLEVRRSLPSKPTASDILQLSIEVEGIQVGPSPQALDANRASTRKVGQYAPVGDDCCVTCGGLTACACRVSQDCGSCCSGACCQ
jgi:hypothetical protein